MRDVPRSATPTRPKADVAGRTLLVVLAHPDDEVGAAGTILAQRARGDDVHVAWMTDGDRTESLGPLPAEEVGRRRREQAREAAGMLGVEPHFFGLPDAGVVATPEVAARVARLIARIEPDGLITFGDAWIRGLRHPDHRETGRIARDAITLARIRKIVTPEAPHRAYCPVFTYRGAHSTLPAVAVDVEPHLEEIYELGRFYRERIGFGDPGWIEARLRAGAERFAAGAGEGLEFAEVWDAWESRPGAVDALLPAEPAGPPQPEPRTD